MVASLRDQLGWLDQIIMWLYHFDLVGLSICDVFFFFLNRLSYQ